MQNQLTFPDQLGHTYIPERVIPCSNRHKVFKVCRKSPNDGKPLLLKIVSESAQNLEKAVASLINETNCLNAINHEAVPKVFDSGTVNNMPYLVTEFFDTDGLNESVFFNLTRAPKTILNIATQLSQITRYLHTIPTESGTKCIVHGDIGTHNLLINKAKKIRLIDFEKSHTFDVGGKVFSEQEILAFPAVKVAGASVFTAPEKFFRKDALHDIYAIGAVIFSLLTGKLLTSPESPTPPKHINFQRPNNFDQLDNGKKIWVNLMEIAIGCTKYDRRERIQSAAQLVSMLKSIHSETQ